MSNHALTGHHQQAECVAFLLTTIDGNALADHLLKQLPLVDNEFIDGLRTYWSTTQRRLLLEKCGSSKLPGLARYEVEAALREGMAATPHVTSRPVRL